MDLRLRFDYGHIVPWVRRVDADLVAVAQVRRGVASHAGRASWGNSSTVADFSVGEGFQVPLCSCGGSRICQPQPVDPMVSLEATEAYWQEWADRCT